MDDRDDRAARAVDGNGDEVDVATLYKDAPDVMAGDRVQVVVEGDKNTIRNAYVRYVGKNVMGMPAGYWVGVQYDDKVGKNDGSINGRRYFRCPLGHGGFIRPPKVRKVASADSAPGETDAAAQAQLVTGSASSARMVHASMIASARGEQYAQLGALGGAGGGGTHSARRLSSVRGPQAPGAPTAKGPMNLAMWQKEIGTARGMIGVATPDGTYATGAGLSTAAVGQLAQFTILAADSSGAKVAKGGDKFRVTMRGVGTVLDSQPALVRTKIIDRRDGTYMVEYRPYLTGAFAVTITLDGCHILGSPYTLTVVTLRPDPSRCVLRGAALNHAVARVPAKFEICFVDAMGNPAHAEDLDVFIEKIDDDPTPADAPTGPSASALSSASASAARLADGETPSAEEAQGGGEVEEGAGLAARAAASDGHADGGEFGAANKDAGQAEAQPAEDEAAHAVTMAEMLGAGDGGSADGGSVDEGGSVTRGFFSGRRYGSPRNGSPGGRRSLLSRPMKLLDAPTRQRHLQLWAGRLAADRLQAAQAKQLAEEAAGSGPPGEGKAKRKGGAATSKAQSFTHELSMDPVGFAFGGVDPGTLHAHGKLVKIHHVSYSVGLAGSYKLHVGLRQQMVELPGSPFALRVEPSSAFAGSSKLPEHALPLSGKADEEWQKGLVFSTADVLGNTCIKGGASVTMRLAAGGGKAQHAADASAVKSKVEDCGNGSYELLWSCQRAGIFSIEVLISGLHVLGSPMQLEVHPAAPEIELFAVSGVGMVTAVAGEEATIRIQVADRFENIITPTGTFPFTFGLLLLPHKEQHQTSGKPGGGDKKGGDKKGAAAGDGVGMKKGARDDERTSPSMSYVGAWMGSSYELRYVAEEAGVTHLHVWASKTPTSVQAMTGTVGGEPAKSSTQPTSPAGQRAAAPPASPGSDGGERKLSAAESTATPAGRGGGAGGSAARGGGAERVPVPGSPFTVHVSEGNASASGSFVKEAEAKQGGGDKEKDKMTKETKEVGGFVAGEHIVIRPQVRDQFGNASTASNGALTAEHELPDGSIVSLEPPKMRGGIGSYESTLEPVKAGVHVVHIKLNGKPISGSPVSFKVTPGAPSVSKCFITKPTHQALEKVPYPIVVTLVDKYGNQLDRGGVRVDAKALGAAASASVDDRRDGTYMINVTGGAPGEVKLSVRIDSVELTPTIAFTVARQLSVEAPAGAPAAPPLSATPSAPPDASSSAAAKPDAGENAAEARRSAREFEGLEPAPALSMMNAEVGALGAVGDGAGLEALGSAEGNVAAATADLA